MTFLGHANQEVDSIRRTNIAMSLSNKIFISSGKISFNAFRVDDGDGINARMNNKKNQQKTFEIGKTFFKSEKTFHRQTYFPKQNSKNWERFLKIPGNQYKGYKEK